jgi:hypothetical protein
MKLIVEQACCGSSAVVTFWRKAFCPLFKGLGG